jgi:four helix bundle protein
MINNNKNLILDLTLKFALDIIDFSEELESKRKYVIANQILKSGCSIGANVKESQGAESRLDFIHKLKVAAKEAEETEYWLTLCNLSTHYPFKQELMDELISIKKVLSKIISSSKIKVSKESAHKQINKPAN